MADAGRRFHEQAVYLLVVGRQQRPLDLFVGGIAVSVAAVLTMDGDRVRTARVVLGGVAPIPWSVPRVDDLLRGQYMTAALANEAGRLAVDGAQPLSKNAYKVTLTKNLVRRTLLSLSAQH